jgi:hypothetical protein
MIGTTWCAESAAMPQMAAGQRLLAGEQRLRLVLHGEQRVVTPCSWRPVSVGTTERPRRSNRRTP